MNLTRSRRLTCAGAAAAALAALAASVAVAHDGTDTNGPVSAPVAEAPAHEPDEGTEGAGWPVVDRARVDVDGDGVRDRIRLRHRTDRLLPGRVRVEADLSSGATPSVLLRDGGLTAALFGPADADGDADREVLLYREDGPREVTVLDWDGADALVAVRQPDQPPLASTYDRRGRARDWWVEDGSLRSTRSVDGFVDNGHDVVTPEQYAVRVWAWTLVDGRLDATSLGRQCVRAARPEEPFPCPGTGGERVPALLPEATDEIRAGEFFTADLDGDGPDTVALVGDVDGDSVEDGQVELVVTLTHGGTTSVPIPAGWAPSVSTTLVRGPGASGILVRQEGGDSSAMTVYGWWNGELGPRPAAGQPDAPRFGSGFETVGEETRAFTTWLTADGRLFTRVTDQAVPGIERYEVWSWDLDGEALTAHEVGPVCFDWEAGTAHRC